MKVICYDILQKRKGKEESHLVSILPNVAKRKKRVGERLVRSFSHQTRDRKELATKQFVLPKLKISESTKVFLGSF